MRRTSQRGLAAISLLLTSTCVSQAELRTWVGADPGGPWWNLPGNWSPAGQPAPGDDVVVLQSGALVQFYNTAWPGAAIANLALNGATAPATLDIGVGGTCDHPFAAAYEDIGLDGHGQVLQSAANHSAFSIYMADFAGSTGTYNLSGGTLNVQQSEVIGYAGSATFLHSGGVNQCAGHISSSLHFGYEPTGNGYYQLSGNGTLSTVNVFLGLQGSGVFAQSGGRHNNAMGMFLGWEIGATGHYTLGDGAYLDLARTLMLGGAGTGSFVQDGGTSMARRDIELGEGPGGHGSYVINDGTLQVYAPQFSALGVILVGYGGTGSFMHNGGLVDIYSTYEPNALILGNDATAVGTYTLNQGTLTANRAECVGLNGAGTFIQAGGINTAPSLLIALNPGSSGIYRQNGGTLNLGTVTNKGTFVHDGGTMTLAGTFTNNGAAEFGASQRFNALALLDASSFIVRPGGGKRITATALSAEGSGFIDLNDNAMVIDYAGTSPFSAIFGFIGSGNVRSSLADGAVRALGYADNAVLKLGDFAGASVDETSVLVALTYCGDTNLDGVVDITDLGALATSWQTSGYWTSGDFDRSGFIDITDLGMLATNWQAGVGNPLKPTGGDPWAFNDALAAVGLSAATVPEPVNLLCGVFLSALLRRRRA